jgi:hypothetical protein
VTTRQKIALLVMEVTEAGLKQGQPEKRGEQQDSSISPPPPKNSDPLRGWYDLARSVKPRGKFVRNNRKESTTTIKPAAAATSIPDSLYVLPEPKTSWRPK